MGGRFLAHVWIGADGKIAIDWPCVQCGYNLRSLAETGSCPECGASVRRSVPIDQRSPATLREYRNAAFVLAASVLAAVLAPPAYEKLLKRIRPPSLMLWEF